MTLTDPTNVEAMNELLKNRKYATLRVWVDVPCKGVCMCEILSCSCQHGFPSDFTLI